MKVNYNISAMIANNELKTSDSKLSDSLQKLSSGLKISNAKDNPSGLAMARRMNAQIQSLKTADDSINDGISIISTADGVLAEVQDMLQRMNELAIKSANGTNSDSDRENIEDELNQIKTEITRVAESTDFNNNMLFDGTYDYRGYATIDGATDSNVKVSTYADSVTPGNLKIENLSCTYSEEKSSVTGSTLKKIEMTDEQKANVKVTDASGKEIENPQISCDGDIISITNDKGFMLQLNVNETLDAKNVDLELTGKGSMSLQIGANEGQLLEMRIPTVSLSNLGIYNTDVTTKERAESAITEAGKGLAYISSIRSKLGAYQNRLEHTDSSTNLATENLTSAYSKIMDVDMAEEMTNYSTQQVLSQAGISVLTQANQRPAEVLQLLQ